MISLFMAAVQPNIVYSMQYKYINQLPDDSLVKKACLTCPKGIFFKTPIERSCYYLEKRLEGSSTTNFDEEKNAISVILGEYTSEAYKRDEYQRFNTFASNLYNRSHKE